jgi:O-antigen/teichoic acid export membrane protein
MSTVLKNLAKHSGVYSIGNVLSNSIAFLLLPIYTRYLTPADYGMLEILSITGEAVIIFCGLGIGNGLVRSFLYEAGNLEQQKEAITTAYIFMGVSSVLTHGLLIISSQPLSLLLLGDSHFALFLLISFITGMLRAGSIIPFQLYRAELESVKYTIISAIQFAIVLIGNIYFIVFADLGILGILYGSLMGAIVIFPINLFLIRRYFVLKFSVAMLKKMLRFGLPLVPSIAALWIILSLDRYFLNHFSNAHELGLYAMGFRFAAILELIFRGPFDTNWPSIYFPLAKQPNAREQFSRILTYYLLVGLFLSLGLSLFAKPAIQIMTGPAFHGAYDIVPLLVLATLFRGVSSNVGIGIAIAGRTEYYVLTVGGAAVVNIGLNFLLIPAFGKMGAAFSTMIAFAFMAFISYAISQKLFSIQYEFGRIGKLLVAFSLPLITHYWLLPDSPVWEIMLDIGLCTSYFVVLFSFKFFSRHEIVWLRELWQRRRPRRAGLTGLYTRF